MKFSDEDIIGKRFGKLVVLEEGEPYVTPSNGKKDRRWRCLCDCGGETLTQKRKLNSGHTKSCGCIKDSYIKEKHGKANKIPEYLVWKRMRSRCNNPNDKFYKDYGGRGIGYAPEWEEFEVFLLDMGKRPTDEHTIERKNVEKGYSKDNCVWTDDLSLQGFNKRGRGNESGKTGISIRYTTKGVPRYCAEITRNGKTRFKTFCTLEDAVNARVSWEEEFYGFQLGH